MDKLKDISALATAIEDDVKAMLTETRNEWRNIWLEQAAMIVADEMLEGSAENIRINLTLVRIAAAIRDLKHGAADEEADQG